MAAEKVANCSNPATREALNELLKLVRDGTGTASGTHRIPVAARFNVSFAFCVQGVGKAALFSGGDGDRGRGGHATWGE